MSPKTQRTVGHVDAHADAEITDNAVHSIFDRLAADFPGKVDDEATPSIELLEISGVVDAVNDLVQPQTAAEACLAPTLALFGWTGGGRLIRECLPHFERMADVEGLRSALALLNYETRRVHARLSELAASDMPCLFSRDGTDVTLIVERNPDGVFLAFDGSSASWQNIQAGDLRGWAFPIVDTSNQERQDDSGKSWLFSAIVRFWPVIVAALGLSFLGNLAALTIPIFVIGVYDFGIATNSKETILMLAIGAGIVIITNLALRSVRARAMAYFGARIDSLIGKEAFEAILNMPVLMIETASVGTQLARLKQFESMRELFTGTLAASIIDVPFIFIFIAAIALWGGQLVWIPLSLIVVYFILSIIALLITRNLTNACGVLKQRRQILLHEIVGKRSAIRMLNAEGVWVLKHRQLSESIAQMNGRIHRFNMVTHSVGEILASVAGVATLGFGALGVAGGSMTAGALIGTMTLVWRVLSPIQSMYLSTPRIDQAMQTFRQIDRLMKIRGERIRSRPRSVPRKFRGKITVQRLAFRYPQSPDAVLRNIELEAKPGEMIAITGASGAGKTTLLRLLAGLYPPAMGAILVDETDLRQVDPLEWRAQISYLPEHSAFFYGSGAQNIRLARPDASDDDVVHALAEMGFEQGQGLFANGIDHRLKARDFENLPDAVRQRLALARCFIKDAPIYLLDNPEASLDSAAEAWLLKKLGALKGKSTVIFSTFRPSHMLVADRLILLKDGQVVLDGPPQHVLQLMQVSFQ